MKHIFLSFNKSLIFPRWVLFGFFMIAALGLRGQELDWVVSLVGDATNRSESIAIDKSGNIVTIGRQRGTVDFDPGPNNTSITTSTTKDALFIQKMSEDSSFLWVRSIVSTSSILGLSVITDSSNSIFVSGFFLGTADFDPGPSTFNLTASPVSLFVVKLDENGDFFNAIKIGAGNSTANTIALSNDNGILLSGTFSSTVDFDPGPGTETKSSLGGEDSYILKLKNDLTFGWVKTFGGSLVDYGRSIIQSKNKNIYITGHFQGTVDFDPGIAISNLTSNGGFDVFIAKYDSSGSFIWAKKTGGSGDDYGFSVNVDKNENVYCLGRFSGAIDVNPNAGIQIITSSSQNNHYLQKLDPSGSFVFGRSLFGYFQDTDRNLCIGDSSIIYVTSHNLLGKYDSIGNLLTSYSPFGFPSPLAITCNDANDVYLTGYFSGTVNFSSIGGGSLNATPGADVFIARLSSLNSPDIPTIGLSSNDSICLGDSVDLFIASGNLNDATDWTWYSGSCGGTLLATGDTIRVSPTSSTTYFVRGEGGGVTPGTCASQTIVPGNTGGGVSASVNDTLVCLGDPLTFTASGGANYQWSGGITDGQTFTTTSPGILLSYVTGEDAFGCTSEDSVYSFVSESYSLADKGKFIGSGFESYIPLYFYCDAAETDSSLYNFNSHWISFTDIFGFIFAPFGNGCPSTTSINQSSDSYEGLNALRMDADTNGFAEASISGILAGRPNKLQGYFKSNAGPNDTIAVIVGAVETGLPASSQDSANYIGYGEFVSMGSTGTYTQFEVPINYSGSAAADSFEIALVFVNNANSGTVKSVWFDAFNLIYDTTVVSICSGDSAFLGGAWQTTAGLYTDNLLTEFGCDSVVLTELEVLPAPNLTVSSDTSICVGESVALTASGASNITWSGGITNGVAFTPALGVNTYTVIGDDGGTCGDTVTLTVTVNDNPTVFISTTTDTVCVGSQVTLTATGALNYSWTGGISNGVAFNPPVGNNFYFVTGTDINGCSDTASTFVQVDAAPTNANAGLDQAACGLSTNLAANTISVGTGTWSQDSGPGLIAFSNGNDPSSGIAATTHGVYVLKWSSENGTCPPSEDLVQITFDETPSPANAGPDQIICGLSTALSGNPISVGTGTWSQLSGPVSISFTNDNDPSTTASTSSSGIYSLVWESSNGTCPDNADTVQVTFNQSPTTATASVSADSICGNSINLNGSFPNIGSGQWMQISGPGTLTYIDDTANITTATASLAGNYTVTWTISNGNCPPSIDSVSFAFFDSPTAANAGADNTVCGLNTTVAGNTIAIGTGTWSQSSGPGTSTFSNANLENSSVTVSAAGTYVYSWKSENGNCSPSEDFVQITFDEAPTVANAGADQTTCDTVVNFAANSISIGTGQWSAVSGPGITTFSNVNLETAVASFSLRGVYELTWTSSNGVCPVSIDTVTISIDSEPSISNAGIDQTLCASSTSLSANTAAVGTGIWTQLSGPGTAVFSNANNPSSNVSTTVAGVYTFEWTISNGSCPSETDQVNITFNESPIAQIDTSGSIDFCQGENVTLNALSPGSGTYAYQWNDGITPIAGATSSSLTVSSSGSYYVIITETGSLCQDSSQNITVTVNPRPTVSAGADTIICAGDLIQLFGSGAVNYSWDNGVTDGVAFTPTATNTYTVIGFDGNNCSDTSSVTVTVNDLPIISLGQDSVLCSNFNQSITLDAGSGFAAYLWSDGSTNQTLLVDEAFNTSNGDVISVEVTDNNTCRNSDTVSIGFSICGALTGTGTELINTIYPNPTSDRLIIEFSNSEKVRLSIYDTKGVLMLEKLADAKEIQLYLRDLPAAKYILKIQGDDIDVQTGIIKN